MKSFKNWFNENFDNVFMHPNRKRAVSVLDSSNGLVYKTKHPPIESLPEGATEISNPHITLIDPSEMQEFKKNFEYLKYSWQLRVGEFATACAKFFKLK